MPATSIRTAFSPRSKIPEQLRNWLDRVAHRSTCVTGGIVIGVATRRAGGLFYETYKVS